MGFGWGIVDAEFVKALIKQKLETQARLEDVCQGIVKPSMSPFLSFLPSFQLEYKCWD